MDQPRRPTTQQDLATILGNPEALHMLAFGVKTMGKFIETGRAMSRMAFEATGLVPPPQSSDRSPSAGSGRRVDHEGPAPVAPGTDANGEATMVVPVSAWNRILEQLGNLHEAGQQLAEARERAARAEATAEFQTERRQQAEAERDLLQEKYTELEQRQQVSEIDLRTEPGAAPAQPLNGDHQGRSDRVRARLARMLDR